MIHEDPDDIGYWVYGRPWMTSLQERCEALLPEWPSITEAALLAHQGLPREAEKSRKRGGYAGLNDPGVWSYAEML